MPNQTPRTRPPTGASEGPPRLPDKGLFRKEGEYWTVGLGGNEFRLKDVKGLAYIAHLLRHPGSEFYALDLIGGIAGRGADVEPNMPAPDLPRGQEDLEKAGIHIASLGDAGEMLDEQAKADFRRRLADLREELEGAKRLRSVERAERIEAEIDTLSRELSRAVGLGGRNRRASSASERARQTINKWQLSQRKAPENLVTAIFEESQGNPFFVEEVYRHLTEEGKVYDAACQFRSQIEIDEIDVPQNVRLIIDRRLERFDEDEKKVLAAACVIGRSFSFQLLTAISQIDVDELFNAIEKAERMGIIVSSSEGPGKPFAFAHELVRQTILANISVPRRRQLHARAGAEIERLYPEAVTEHAGEIVDHLLRAGLFAGRDALVRSLTAAGNAALEAAAFEEARAHFQSALSRLDQTDSRQRAKLLERIGAAYWGLERREEAIARLGEALEICILLDDRRMIATAYADLADALTWAAHNPEAIELGRRGLAFLENDTGPERVRLLAATAEALANTAGYEPAQEAMTEAIDLSSKLPDPKLESRLLTARILLNHRLFRIREVADDGLRSEALPLTGPKATWERVIRLSVLTEALSYLGRLEEAVRIADKLEPLAKKVAHALAVANCHWVRAWSQFGREPDLVKLQNNLQEASKPEHIQHSPYWEFASHLLLGIVDFYRGNWHGAMTHARACSGLGAVLSLEGIGVGLVFRQLAYQGDRHRALPILQENHSYLPVDGEHNAIGSWWMLVLAIEGLFILNEESQAGELYPLVLELLDRGVVLFYCSFRFVQTIAGMAAAAAGQFEAAEDHFRIALKQGESLPFHFEKAEINRFHAMMLIKRARPGDREQARSLISAALASYERFGMPRHVELTLALLDRGSPAKSAPLPSASTRAKK